MAGRPRMSRCGRRRARGSFSTLPDSPPGQVRREAGLGVPADHRGRPGDLAGVGDVEQQRGDLTAGRGADQLVTVGFRRIPAWTCCPAAARRSAGARPMPEEAPVTRVCLRLQFMAPPFREAVSVRLRRRGRGNIRPASRCVGGRGTLRLCPGRSGTGPTRGGPLAAGLAGHLGGEGRRCPAWRRYARDGSERRAATHTTARRSAGWTVPRRQGQPQFSSVPFDSHSRYFGALARATAVPRVTQGRFGPGQVTGGVEPLRHPGGLALVQAEPRARPGHRGPGRARVLGGERQLERPPRCIPDAGTATPTGSSDATAGSLPAYRWLCSGWGHAATPRMPGSALAPSSTGRWPSAAG